MKKIICLAYAFVLLIAINSCVGYEPVFESKKLSFKISNYSIEGNQKLGNRIYSRLFNSSKPSKDEQNIRNVDLYINVSKGKNSTSKDGTGKILEYNINLNTKVIIKDNISNNELVNQSFARSASYKVQDQHSKTLKLENQTTENLIENTYQDLLIVFINNFKIQ